ncbi:nitrite reductase large subunit, partial [Moraxella osloensis]
MKNLIVIGNGMVGHHFIEKAIEKNLHQIYQIHVFSAEKRPAYDRVYLSSYFEHKDASQLNLVDLANYEQAGITLHLGEAVNHIDAQSKIVTTIKGNALEFDKLVLATGSYPFVPPVKGNQHAHCHVYRTIEDLDAILATADNPRVQRG